MGSLVEMQFPRPVRQTFLRLTTQGEPSLVRPEEVVAVHAMRSGLTQLVLASGSYLQVEEPVESVVGLIEQAGGK